MNYLSAEGLSKSYNEKWLFQNIALGINRGQKVALVGINGSGKSTLLKILARKVNPDGGKVVYNADITVGFLDQDPEFVKGQTVKEALFHSGGEIIKAIKQYELCLEDSTKDLQSAMERMDKLEAWDYEQKVTQIISRMGILDLDQKVDSLSGGQKKRVALAQVLIDNPDLIIMDEPTNHLDLDTIEWLEGYLSTQNTTLLLVTHDRYFLDKVANEIVELDRGQMFSYKGNYSYFLEKKSEREAIKLSEVDKAKNLLTKELDWMRRQPKARGTKSKSRIDAFYETEKKAKDIVQDQKMELNVQTARQGNKVIEVDSISKSFNNKKVVDNFSYIFKKKDRIGIVGKNGAGKSTLLNMLTGILDPDSGKVDKGQTTGFGYFTQKGLDIQEDMRVIEVVKEIAEYITMGDGTTIGVSKFLEYFLFPPAMQYTPVSKLSGGEKKRLQLLRILVKNPNFLILDEPTNDFDLNTLNVLEDFLEAFGGCIIIVSHDRYFMDKVVEHLFVFEGDGKIRDFYGNYTDYRDWLDENPITETIVSKPAEEKQAEIPVSETSSKKLSYKEKKEYEDLEKELEKMEAKKAALIEQMNAAAGDYTKIASLSAEIDSATKQIEAKSERWLELADKM